jgi:hypothetical protein
MISQLKLNLQNRVRSELKPGESIVWIGQPNPNRLMWTGFLLWFFFIPWTAFSLFWTAGAAGFRIPTFTRITDLFPLFGLPFILIGLGGLSSPFWIRWKALNTVYVITDRRAFSLEGGRTFVVRNYTPEKLGNLVRKERDDGSGDLILDTTWYKDSDGDSRKNELGFYGIPDVKRVEYLLERLAANRQLP